MINGVMNMREYVTKGFDIAKKAILSALLLFCIFDTGSAAAAVGESINKCVNIVIPSLFAMLAVSTLFIRSGINGRFPRWMGKFSRALFGMESSVFPIFTFGMFAGYPVGVKMLCDEYSAGRLSKRRAELLSGLCFGAGPAFVFGCISRQLYSSDRAGIIILISNVSANFILAFIMSFALRKTVEEHLKPKKCSLSADMLTECVLKSGRAMADICIMVVFFSVLTAFLSRAGAAAGELFGKLPDLDRKSGEVIVAALLDVTNIGKLPRGDWLLLPYVSGASAFGGVCVMFQISALTAGRFSLKPFILLRCAAAVLSYFICRMVMPFLMEAETVAVSTMKVSSVSNNSPIPSVMLVLMTVMLMLEFDKKRGKNTA
jgi:hypothetical protein